MYNPRFSRASSHDRFSYSRPFRPDIGLIVPKGANAGLHLLDAKFRLDRIDTVFPHDADVDETQDEIAEERRGTFKRGDLYKMHAYRDAIPAARSVWVLYPGTEVRFFGCCDDIRKSCEELCDSLEGVGAVPLRPCEGYRELTCVLANLLAVG